MKIEKMIISDDEGNQQEFKISDGAGIFITDDGRRLILPSNNDSINLDVIRSVLSRWQ